MSATKRTTEDPGGARRYLDARELADYIHSTLSSVRTLTSKRQIPHIKRGRRCLYDRVAIDRWLAQQSVKPIRMS